MSYISESSLNPRPQFEVLRESNWSSNKEFASKAAITTMAVGLIVMLATVLAAHGCGIPHHGMAPITDLAKYKFMLVAGAGLTTIGALSWLYLKSQKSDAVWEEKCQEMINNPDFQNFLSSVATTLNKSVDEKAYFSLSKGETIILEHITQDVDKVVKTETTELTANANLIAFKNGDKITFKIFKSDVLFKKELAAVTTESGIEDEVSQTDVSTEAKSNGGLLVEQFSRENVNTITARLSSPVTQDEVLTEPLPSWW